MADGRSLLTDREREILEGEADVSDNYRYKVESVARQRVRQEEQDVAVRVRDGGWTTVGSLSGVSGMDGDLVASDDGVYRVLEDGLRHVGLERAVDVAAAGVPLAATTDGLFQLANGWIEIAEGAFRFVASDPGARPGALGRAHAGTDDELIGHHDDAWEVETTLDQPVVDVTYGDTVYAVSADGRFVAETPDAWRQHELGVREVTAAAAARQSTE
jgi:hypothetical protein